MSDVKMTKPQGFGVTKRGKCIEAGTNLRRAVTAVTAHNRGPDCGMIWTT